MTTRLAPSGDLARRAIQSLENLLLPESGSRTDLASQIAPLEQALSLHAAALHIALNEANPTAESVRKAIQQEHSLAGSGDAVASSSLSTAIESGAPTASATNEALRSHNHKALGSFLQSLDLETAAGITRAIGEAFNGTMLLPARVLFNTSSLGDPLAK